MRGVGSPPSADQQAGGRVRSDPGGPSPSLQLDPNRRPVLTSPVDAAPTTDRYIGDLLPMRRIPASHGTTLLPRGRHRLDDSGTPITSAHVSIARWLFRHRRSLARASWLSPSNPERYGGRRDRSYAWLSSRRGPRPVLAAEEGQPADDHQRRRRRWRRTRSSASHVIVRTEP
jgi:hypothetical protein